MNILIYLIVFISAIIYGCNPSSVVQQSPAPSNSNQATSYDFRIMTYNVENLFDIYDDSLKKDEDFLPWGINKWNRERYQDKLKKIFKVIANVSEWEYPSLIALTEIENQSVLEELVHGTPLSESDYHIIHEESPDARGIDVALLYRRSLFRPIQHQIIPVTMPNDSLFKTRDILYVSGIVHHTDTLHFFVVHFPSRRGGEAISEPKRIIAAEKVREKCDSILAKQAHANIIITGDFNDEPINTSTFEILRGKGYQNEMQEGDFFNMMYDTYKKGYGSYKFQSSWNLIDQFIISPSLLNTNNSIYTTIHSARIFQPEWLSIKDDAYPGVKPFRTYSGPNYIGGYSDHYPIFMDIFFKK
ncbi:MAG: hypothetical protein LC105_12085 [Chitinophagales bacterium]|nr:hypothetical protein [Chitinophagales bacterium]MCZ2394590.1 hypothetical protein [Chitinophagales bacterium]